MDILKGPMPLDWEQQRQLPGFTEYAACDVGFAETGSSSAESNGGTGAARCARSPDRWRGPTGDCAAYGFCRCDRGGGGTADRHSPPESPRPALCLGHRPVLRTPTDKLGRWNVRCPNAACGQLSFQSRLSADGRFQQRAVARPRQARDARDLRENRGARIKQMTPAACAPVDE